MSDLRVEEVEGTTVTTVVPTSATPTDLSAKSEQSADTPDAETPPPASDATRDAAGEAEAPDEAPEPEKKTKYQSRIDRLVQERYEAEARAKLLEEELERLRRPEPPPQAPPEPETEPQRGDFPDDDQYIAALVAYRTRREVEPVLAAVRQSIEAERQERGRVEALRTYHERIAAMRSDYPDFDEVTSKDLPVSPVMADLIVSSPVGPRVSYYLGSHPEECVRLSQLPPIQAAKEMGVLEARLSAATTGTATQATRSAAPPPVKPVGGAPTAAASSLWDQHISQTEWERIRNAQEAEYRRSR